MVVCSCVCILRPTGTEDDNKGWQGAKAMLSNTSLLKSLQEYKKDEIKEKQIRKIRAIMDKEANAFDSKIMLSVSKAGYGLLQWVLAMVRYYDAAKRVETKRNPKAPVVEEPFDETPGELAAGAVQDPRSTGLAAIKDALQGLDRKDLQELKALNKPPRGVDTACQAVAYLMGYSQVDATWKDCQVMMKNPAAFVARLRAMDTDAIPEEAVAKAKAMEWVPPLDDKAAEAEVLKTLACKSRAVACLGTWVIKVLQYRALPSAERSVQQGASEEKENAEPLLCTPSKDLLSTPAQALVSLPSISKKAVVELKGYSKPPMQVAETLSLVAALFGKEPSWAEAHKMRSDVGFLKKLCAFSVESLVHQDPGDLIPGHVGQVT
jgi:hypothetical protein